MYKTFNLKEKIVAFFSQNPVKQARDRDIAEWIIQNYPDDCEQKILNAKGPIDTSSDLAQRIIYNLYDAGRHPPSMNRLLKDGVERIKVDSQWGFGRIDTSSNAITENSHTDTVTNTSSQEIVPEKKNIKEKDMYPNRIFAIKTRSL